MNEELAVKSIFFAVSSKCVTSIFLPSVSLSPIFLKCIFYRFLPVAELHLLAPLYSLFDSWLGSSFLFLLISWRSTRINTSSFPFSFIDLYFHILFQEDVNKLRRHSFFLMSAILDLCVTNLNLYTSLSLAKPSPCQL